MKRLIPLLLILASVPAIAADAPELPTLLDANATPAVNIEATFGDGPARDEQWHADVEDALRYLYLRQNDVLERLEKLEAVSVKVETPTGTVTRSVPVRNGTGYFQLAPGEVLYSYEDPITGRQVRAAQPTQTVTNYRQQPVQVYSSPAVQVRTYSQPQTTYTRGRVRVWSRSRGFRGGSCANGQCSL